MISSFPPFKFDLLILLLEPIEQNVHGSKGVYELVYFVKESKMLEKFKKHAIQSDKCTDGKDQDEIENLVI